MFNFFNKEKNKSIEDPLTKIAALLIHVARIDENYTEKVRNITLPHWGRRNKGLNLDAMRASSPSDLTSLSTLTKDSFLSSSALMRAERRGKNSMRRGFSMTRLSLSSEMYLDGLESAESAELPLFPSLHKKPSRTYFSTLKHLARCSASSSIASHGYNLRYNLSRGNEQEGKFDDDDDE